MSVSRNAGGLIDYGLSHSYETVEKCGLADIRTAHYCYQTHY